MDDNSTQEELGLALDTEPKKSKLLKIVKSKTFIIPLAFLIAVAFAFYYKSLFIVATVDGRPISRLAVIRRIEKQSGKVTLDAIINKLLVSSEARKKGITVSDTEVQDELKKIEDQIAEQGGSMDAFLTAQGMDTDELKKQIILQKQVEKILSDKAQILDSDIEQYIKDNKVTIPKGMEAEYRNQIKDQLRGQKLDEAFGRLLDDLRAKALINYFIKY